MSTDSDVQSSVLAAQRAYFDAGRTRPLGTRRDALRALDAELVRRTDDALAALAADFGKPPLEAWLSEIHFTRAEIRHCLRHLTRWARPRRVRNPLYLLPARSEVRREPFGLVLIAGPWNYPLQLALGPLHAAVAAGNCVVLKPSELAPVTSRFLAELIAEVFDPAHVAVVEGGAETGAALLEQPFDFFFFTGGEKAGRFYAEAAASRLVPVTLELGGKCPCVLTEGTDLELAAARIVSAKFFNAGQTCVAPDFVLLPDALHDPFLSATRAAIEASYGTSPSPDLARIVNDRHYERLLALIPPGAIRIGSDDRHARYLAPRLIPRADWNSAAMQEEIFGPVLPVITYNDLYAALKRLNTLPSPLAIYAFGKERRTLEKIAAAVRSGAVCFNDTMKQAANHLLPLGGVGPSGLGRYHGLAGFENFTYQRSVTRRWQIWDPFLLKPPHGKRLAFLRKWLKP